jgi:hypothetical protein
MKKILVSLMLVAMVVVTGCSQTVNPGFVAKKITPSGVQPELYETGKVWVMPRQRLVHVDVSSHLRQAPVEVIMADRGLNDDGEMEQRIGLGMNFLVNIRYRINDDPLTIDAALRDMTLDGNTSSIGGEQFYQKYGNMVVGRVTREVLGRYTPEEVLENLPTINQQLEAGIREGLKTSPIVASSVSLGPITLPRVITERIEQNKNTELSEAQARAQQRIDLLEQRNQIELARQTAVRQEIDAQSLANQNRILAESVTQEVLRLRELQIREREIEMMREGLQRGNSTIFIPYGAVDNIGAQNRMFQGK